MVLAVALWAAWHGTGDWTLCWLFWLLMFAIVKPFCHRDGMLLVILGLLMNATVILLNGGVMPVVGMEVQPWCPIWTLATSQTKLLWLADQKALWYFSLGDLCLLSGVGITLMKFRKGTVTA